MKLKIRKTGKVLGPQETLVLVDSKSGTEEVLISESSILDDMIEVGFPVAQDKDKYFLIELPRETARGQWRVWVHPEQLETGGDAREIA